VKACIWVRAMPPEPSNADHLGIGARHVFDPDTAVGAHPHMLQMAIIDEG